MTTATRPQGTHLADEDVLGEEVPATLSALGGAAEIDVQVSTARRYPRSVATFIKKATEMATLSPEIAAACVYALPRKEGGKAKTIEGPSARFAEIMASAWTNMRAEGKTLGNDGQFVTSRGTAWDVENNVAIAFEVQRRITNRDGRTFTDDMISVTGNAGASVALRNAILKVIPTAFWKPIYNDCRKVIAGDVRTFAARRDDMLKLFAVMGVTAERLLASIGVGGIEDVTLDHIVTLRGIYNALKEGETTIEEAFPEGGGLKAPAPSTRKSQQQPTEQAADKKVEGSEPASSEREARSRETTSQASGAVVGASESSAATNVGTIDEVKRSGAGWMLKLNTGFYAATREEFLAKSAEDHRDKKTVVRLATKPARDAKYAPNLEGISVVES